MSVLRTLREQHGLTQAEVCRRIDYDPTNLSRVEAGKQGLTLDLARKLSGLYGVSIDSLVCQK